MISLDRIRDQLCRIFTPTPKEKPEDLKKFEEARARLIECTDNLKREADTFGDLVRGMQERKHKNGNKKRSPRS